MALLHAAGFGRTRVAVHIRCHVSAIVDVDNLVLQLR